MGIVGLLALIAILITVRATMHYWVTPDMVEMKHVVIAAKKIDSVSKYPAGFTKVKKQLPTEKINLNTADSLMLISLPGIGKGLSHRILERRRELGKFTSMEQVFEVYKFKEETRQMLLENTVIN